MKPKKLFGIPKITKAVTKVAKDIITIILKKLRIVLITNSRLKWILDWITPLKMWAKKPVRQPMKE